MPVVGAWSAPTPLVTEGQKQREETVPNACGEPQACTGDRRGIAPTCGACPARICHAMLCPAPRSSPPPSWDRNEGTRRVEALQVPSASVMQPALTSVRDSFQFGPTFFSHGVFRLAEYFQSRFSRCRFPS